MDSSQPRRHRYVGAATPEVAPDAKSALSSPAVLAVWPLSSTSSSVKRLVAAPSGRCVAISFEDGTAQIHPLPDEGSHDTGRGSLSPFSLGCVTDVRMVSTATRDLAITITAAGTSSHVRVWCSLAKRPLRISADLPESLQPATHTGVRDYVALVAPSFGLLAAAYSSGSSGNAPLYAVRSAVHCISFVWQLEEVAESQSGAAQLRLDRLIELAGPRERVATVFVLGGAQPRLLLGVAGGVRWWELGASSTVPPPRDKAGHFAGLPEETLVTTATAGGCDETSQGGLKGLRAVMVSRIGCAADKFDTLTLLDSQQRLWLSRGWAAAGPKTEGIQIVPLGLPFGIADACHIPLVVAEQADSAAAATLRTGIDTGNGEPTLCQAPAVDDSLASGTGIEGLALALLVADGRHGLFWVHARWPRDDDSDGDGGKTESSFASALVKMGQAALSTHTVTGLGTVSADCVAAWGDCKLSLWLHNFPASTGAGQGTVHLQVGRLGS